MLVRARDIGAEKYVSLRRIGDQEDRSWYVGPDRGFAFEYITWSSKVLMTVQIIKSLFWSTLLILSTKYKCNSAATIRTYLMSRRWNFGNSRHIHTVFESTLRRVTYEVDLSTIPPTQRLNILDSSMPSNHLQSVATDSPNAELIASCHRIKSTYVVKM